MGDAMNATHRTVDPNVRNLRDQACLWFIVFFVGTCTVTQGNDWPEFRGPTGQGIAADTPVALEWNEDKNITWKTQIPGLGWSSPVIANDKVWLTTFSATNNGSLRLLGFSTTTGESIADVEVFRIGDTEPPNPKNSLASPTPAIDPSGTRIYVHFGAYGTAALTTTGEILWTIRLPYVSQHGNGGSPIVYDDLVLLNVDGYDTAFIVALDAATGNERGRATRPEPISQAYTTPHVISVGQQQQVISVAAFRTIALNPKSGEEIWHVNYPNGFSNVPRPVYGHGFVYITTGFQTPTLLAIRVDGIGDVTNSHVSWKLRRGAPLTPSPLLVGDELYFVTDFGIATCVDAFTGAIHWQERLGGNHSASPVFAGGRIYFQNEEGRTKVIAPGKEFRQLADNTLDGSTLASMAVSRTSLFIRTDTHLYRIDE